MTQRLLTLAAIALLAIPAVQAQATGTNNPAATRREQAADRREAAAARRDAAAERREAAGDRRGGMSAAQRDAARSRRADRGSAMPEAQAQFRQDMRVYRDGLREKAADLRAQLKAGTITADDMAAQLKAYRDANRPKNPAAAKPESDTP